MKILLRIYPTCGGSEVSSGFMSEESQKKNHIMEVKDGRRSLNDFKKNVQ